MSRLPKGYADLADLPEDQRIEIIGATAAGGAVVAFIVDDDVKADRYIRKLARRFPTVRVVDRGPGPVADTVLVRCGPAKETVSLVPIVARDSVTPPIASPQLRTREMSGWTLPSTACLADRFGLTERQAEVALLLAIGNTNRDVARRLGVSEHTARHHTEQVMYKLRVKSRAAIGARIAGTPAPGGKNT